VRQRLGLLGGGRASGRTRHGFVEVVTPRR
jgi:hypothetical protein